jgi:hypothetical protein
MAELCGMEGRKEGGNYLGEVVRDCYKEDEKLANSLSLFFKIQTHTLLEQHSFTSTL